MNPLSAAAIAYLSPPKNSFWMWDERGQAICFRDGTTVAFRHELREMVAALPAHGLPPMTALVLVLAACRDSWISNGAARLPQAWLDLLHPPLRQGLLDGLRVIAGMPSVQRRSAGALGQQLFEFTLPRTPAGVAGEVVAFLQGDIPWDELVVEIEGAEGFADFRRAVDALAPGLKRFSPQAMQLRMQTGLDALPEAADVEVEVPQRIRALITRLLGDPELGPMARLARDLLAAVHVPRTLVAQEQLAAGGYSDLTHRGPLDRLLISELAHDDLTLAVRVAMNEALYLRREPPSAPPSHRRVIVLDSGIRLWGAPRVFATAVAMALAASADRKSAVSIFRARGAGEIDKVDLSTRAGLIDHLQCLETSAHPGKAFAALLEKEAFNDDIDLILVTHRDVLSDRKFDALVAEGSQRRSWFAAAVDREGGFRFCAIGAAGRRELRRATLKLEQILAGPPEKAHAAIVTKGDADLPVVFAMKPFPLRLPTIPDPQLAAVTRDNGLVAVTKDRTLLYWPSSKIGGLQLTDQMPAGSIRAVHVHDDWAAAYVLIAPSPGGERGENERGACYLLRAELSGQDVSFKPLPTNQANFVGSVFHRHWVYLIGKTHAEAFALASGARVGSVALPAGARWKFGRFMQGAISYWALNFNGSALELVDVPTMPQPPSFVFEHANSDGPLGLFPDGSIRSIADPPKISIDPPVAGFQLHADHPVAAIAPDGRRIAVREFGKQYFVSVSPGQRYQALRMAGERAVRMPAIHNALSTWGDLSRRFGSIFRAGNGALTLVSSRDLCKYEIALVGSGALSLVKLGRYGPADPPAVSFKRRPRRMNVGYDLYEAKWADGSVAFLDGRGLLHLKSSDSSVPQVTLVLMKGRPLAGWSSDGKTFGSDYFHGQPVSWVASHFDEFLRRFTERLR